MAEHASHGKELFCPSCDVKPQARAIEDLPDGTIRHRTCGQFLELIDPEPPAAAKEAQKSAKKARKAKPKAQAAPVPVEAPAAVADGPKLEGLAKLATCTQQLTAIAGRCSVTRGPGGWLIEAFIQEG